jgi:hypothetical protein
MSESEVIQMALQCFFDSDARISAIVAKLSDKEIDEQLQQLTEDEMATYQQAERKYSKPGQHYDPWKRARLTDGRKVWIVRQDGDGESAWYFTDQNEKIATSEIDDWL